ncbi:MAG: hypothetical protein U0904_11850, partial [Candidatus Nanopelagicales bacterium]|nr:hypothetical protein [Candidatus Nanopelagicales bacterium]
MAAIERRKEQEEAEGAEKAVPRVGPGLRQPLVPAGPAPAGIVTGQLPSPHSTFGPPVPAGPAPAGIVTGQLPSPHST